MGALQPRKPVVLSLAILALLLAGPGLAYADVQYSI
jgi:hypothetical protein